MKIGETGVTHLEIRTGDARSEAGPYIGLRGIGVSPVRVGFYRVTVERITKEQYDSEMETLQREGA